MRLPEIDVEVDCRAGTAPPRPPGAAISRYDYVKINADLLLAHRERAGRRRVQGRPARQLQPGLQGVRLLVQALGYIDRFKGQKCVIKYGGAAMSTDALKEQRSARTCLLLRAVGLLPGRGPRRRSGHLARAGAARRKAGVHRGAAGDPGGRSQGGPRWCSPARSTPRS